MSETELSAYCREKGLYPEQIQGWKEAYLHGAGQQQNQQKEAQRQQKQSKKKIHKPESELRRKDKAMAETTSLLVLSKKLEALYASDRDDDSGLR